MKQLRIGGQSLPRLDIAERVQGSIVGPGLSAIREACSSCRDQLAGLMPVFEKIGRHIDTSASKPGHDTLFSANGRRVIVAVSDLLWGDLVLITEVRSDELARALSAHSLPLTGKQLSDAICHGWAQWSRSARRSFRRSAPAWNELATLSVGGLLFISPGAQFKLAQLVSGDEVPVLAIALNSKGTTRTRLRCNVRAVVFPLPSWARASGTVAGCA